ncbi:MAG: deoxyguanosinetriphosphate triphosphohydrolase [Candidatus Saccharibacteria bacterium]
MKIREEYEKREAETLSPYAMLSNASRGRRVPINKCDIRTDFQRDRDRIIHSKAFRRLKHKTQVFIAPEGDHYRTRLTHTLEVAQIARTIARALRLNEDLTEAIALGHDLGHTPFGHAGEKALDEIYLEGFRHYEQSLRVVDVLEGDGGLNLTYEVRDGILKHTGDAEPETLEGVIVKISDRVAYINHDIDDALRAGIIRFDQLPRDCVEILGIEHSQRINSMVVDIIRNSMSKPQVSMSERVGQATHRLREYLFEHVYLNPQAKNEEEKVRSMVQKIYQFLLARPELLAETSKEDGCANERAAIDFIAGMTDHYAIRFFKDNFMPLPWADLE